MTPEVALDYDLIEENYPFCRLSGPANVLIMSAATLLPNFPQSSIEYLFVKPNRNPEANISPAPVVSTRSFTVMGVTKFSI